MDLWWSDELLGDLFKKSGGICPAKQDHKNAVHELHFLRAKKELLFATKMLDNSEKISCTEPIAAHCQPMHCNDSKPSIEGKIYAR